MKFDKRTRVVYENVFSVAFGHVVDKLSIVKVMCSGSGIEFVCRRQKQEPNRWYFCVCV